MSTPLEGGPRSDPRSQFGDRVARQIDWANRRKCQAEVDNDWGAVEAWRGYVHALRWVQSIGSPNPPSRDAGTIVEIFKIDGGTGTVKYRRSDGTDDRVKVIAEGWGDGYGSTPKWPPRVGDEIDIFNHQTVFVKRRPS